MNKKEFLKHSWGYSISTQLAQLITLVTSILFRRFLGPGQTGIWSALQVIVDYSKYTSLGLMDAAAREIPIHSGSQNRDMVNEIKNSAFSFVMINSALLAAGIITVSFLIRDRISPVVFTGLLLISVLIFLQRLNNMLIAFLRCFKQFEIESRLMVWSSIVNGVLVAALSYYFQIYGFMIAMMISFTFNILFIFLSYSFSFKFTTQFKKVGGLLSLGLPLMGLNVLVTILKSLDRVLIPKWLGFEALGFYSIAIMAVGYLNNFPVAFGIVLQPYLREKFGETNDAKNLNHYLLKFSFGLTLILCLLISGVWALAPEAIRLFLPAFREGIPAMRLLALSILFSSLGQVYYDYLITLKKLTPLFVINVTGIIFIALGNWLLLDQKLGILGFAVVSTAFSFINFMALSIWSNQYSGDRKNTLTTIAICLIGFFYLFAEYLIIENYGHDNWKTECLIAGLFCFPLSMVLCKMIDLSRFFKKQQKN